MTGLLLVTIIAGALIIGLILGARRLEARHWARSLLGFRLQLPDDLSLEQVSAWLGSINTITHAARWAVLPMPPLVLEIVATSAGIEYVISVPRSLHGAVLSGVRAHLPGARLEELSEVQRPRPTFAAEARLSSRLRPLAIERSEASIAGLLASLQPLLPDEAITVQWIMTGAGTPRPPQQTFVGSPSVLARLAGHEDLSDPAMRRAMQLKHSAPLLQASLRVGITAASPSRSLSLYGRVWPNLRTLNAPGAQLVRSWAPSSLVARRLQERCLPLVTWPLLLNSREAAGLLGVRVHGMPVVGIRQALSRVLPPPVGLSRHGNVVAQSNYLGADERLMLSREDRLRHVYAVGPTGVGKSTWIASMALQDADYGDGLMVLDPKGDLITAIVARLPAHRQADVIIVNAADLAQPIGYNVLASSSNEHEHELAADFVLSVMRSLWASSWGPRTDDVLRSALLTLTHTHAVDGSAFTLVEVPHLLTNVAFRRLVTAQPTMPRSLLGFWAWFETLSEPQLTQVIGPVMNKLRSFTTRTSLRLTLGQTQGLNLEAAMREKKIVLVSLARGVIGNDAAYLLGSLFMAGMVQATLRRAALAPELRRPFWLYLDEAHQLTRLPIALADLLAEARGLGVGIHMANQFIGQLSSEMRTAVLGTVRSLVSFHVEDPDARLLEPRFAPLLSARDLVGLGAYEVALSLCSNNQILAPTTGTTLDLPPGTNDVAAWHDASRQRFGTKRQDIEDALVQRLTVDRSGFVGKRPRGGRA